ncbi:MAG: hypothetical protein JWR02_1541 [Mucilaginibacter sp.]|nr:hypothetical protein [Mucilaginibacter sp.]
MNTVIQGTPEEFLDVVRQAIREELTMHSQQSIKQPVQTLSKKEAAKYLHLSLSTLERLLKGGEVPFFNIGKRIFIKQVDIEDFLNKKG